MIGDVIFRLENDGERWWWTATVTLNGVSYTDQDRTQVKAAENLFVQIQNREAIAKQIKVEAFPEPPKPPTWLERIFGKQR